MSRRHGREGGREGEHTGRAHGKFPAWDGARNFPSVSIEKFYASVTRRFGFSPCGRRNSRFVNFTRPNVELSPIFRIPPRHIFFSKRNVAAFQQISVPSPKNRNIYIYIYVSDQLSFRALGKGDVGDDVGETWYPSRVREREGGKSLERCCRECFRVVGMFNEAKNSWRDPGTGSRFGHGRKLRGKRKFTWVSSCVSRPATYTPNYNYLTSTASYY